MSSWQWRNCVRRGIKMESPKTWATETIDFEWNVKNFNWNLPLENLLGNDRLYEHRRPSRCCSSLLCHAPSSVHQIWKRFKDTRKFPLFFLSYNSLSLVGDFKFTMRKFVKSMGESEEWDGTEVDGNFLFCLLFIFTLLVNEDLMPMTQKKKMPCCDEETLTAKQAAEYFHKFRQTSMAGKKRCSSENSQQKRSQI